MIKIKSNIFPKTQGTFIVGGSIRDLFLDRTPIDFDIAVLDDPQEYAQQIALNTAGHMVEIGEADQKIIRVISGRHIFDISPIHGSSIEEDLHQRDFTINAMAYELSSERLIDCFGGCQDLTDKKIRMVSDDIFIKDPVRLIRAYRLAACLDFIIEQKTESAIRRHAGRVQQSAGERIREEFFKMLQSANSYNFVCQMADTGVLFAIFPELARLKKKHPQKEDPTCDPFEHTLNALGRLEDILSSCHPFMSNPVKQSLDKTRTILLKFSMLLHDIGKSETQRLDQEGAFQLNGHAEKSAEMSTAVCKRLKFSNRDKDYIHFIIQNHTHPIFLFTVHQNKSLTRRDLTRFFMRSRDRTPDLLLHAIADMEAGGGQIKAGSQTFSDFAIEMIQDYFAVFKPKESMPAPITGHDLIKEFRLAPSPLFKSILNGIEEERLSRTEMTREDALELVKSILKNQQPTQGV